jgi:hypothetical protein
VLNVTKKAVATDRGVLVIVLDAGGVVVLVVMIGDGRRGDKIRSTATAQKAMKQDNNRRAKPARSVWKAAWNENFQVAFEVKEQKRGRSVRDVYISTCCTSTQ